MTLGGSLLAVALTLMQARGGVPALPSSMTERGVVAGRYSGAAEEQLAGGRTTQLQAISCEIRPDGAIVFTALDGKPTVMPWAGDRWRYEQAGRIEGVPHAFGPLLVIEQTITVGGQQGRTFIYLAREPR